jgi:hypothetical protein
MTTLGKPSNATHKPSNSCLGEGYMYFFIVQIHVDRRLYIFRLCVELQVVFFFFFFK